MRTLLFVALGDIITSLNDYLAWRGVKISVREHPFAGGLSWLFGLLALGLCIAMDFADLARLQK